MERFWAKVDKNGPTMPGMTTPCWVWTAGKDGYGYGVFRRNGKTERAHRLAYEAEHGLLGVGRCALHHCDNPACVRADHLYEGTKKNNAQDRERRGRSNHATGVRHGCATHPGLRRGERNGRSKLTEDRVRDLLREHKQGTRKAVLARKYDLSKTSVGHIVSGKLWPHVER